MTWCSCASTNKLLVQLIHKPKCLFWIICTVPSTMRRESKQQWSLHLRPWQAHACSPWPVSGLMHHFCHTENRTLDTPIKQREERGPRWDLSGLTSPDGLKELKLFWATSAAECKLRFGKLDFSAPRGYNNIPHIFLHSCSWLSSQQCPTDQEENGFSKMFLLLVH